MDAFIDIEGIINNMERTMNKRELSKQKNFESKERKKRMAWQFLLAQSFLKSNDKEKFYQILNEVKQDYKELKSNSTLKEEVYNHFDNLLLLKVEYLRVNFMNRNFEEEILGIFYISPKGSRAEQKILDTWLIMRVKYRNMKREGY
ncbi:MAG: hypothetical protein KAI16_01640 [Candidatus Pacebacteria bacterium]|nr:hypothetical protein [Candidatus Paceibacterota bacterium]